MSPLVHAGAGWLLAQPLCSRRERALVVVAAVIPDIDGAGIVLSLELYERWHHRLAHGVFAAITVTLVAAALSMHWRTARCPRTPFAPGGEQPPAASPPMHLVVLACLAFHSHVLMDLAGSGPGWPIFYSWPLGDTAWLPAWQWDLANWQNTVIGALVIACCLWCALPFQRTPVELFSLRADARVVEALRRRLAPLRRGA